MIDLKARKMQRGYKPSGKKTRIKRNGKKKIFLPSRKGGKLNQHVSENKELGGHFCIFPRGLLNWRSVSADHPPNIEFTLWQ